MRAECALKIRNVLEKNIDDDQSQSFAAPSGNGKPYPLKENERLDLIAATELGDAGRWMEIAAMNDIVDAAAITDSHGKRPQTLFLPED